MRKRRVRTPAKKASLGMLAVVLLLALAFALAEKAGLLKPLGEESPPAAFTASTAPAVEESGPEKPGLEVYFLDVGQGDCELIRCAGRDGTWNMLIDTGEYAYADGLTESLRDLGVEKLDALACSHPHTDHMGCMARMIQRFEIDTFYMPLVPEDLVPTTSAYEALLDAVDDQDGLGIMALHQNTVIDCPAGLDIQVLAPRQDADWEDLNNWSAVFRLTYGETSFLFTGDAEKQSEKNILEDAEALGWDLKADVLKCGHHGSSTSSSAKFLKAVIPSCAVISCGKGNDYGHPHKETLQKLDKLGTKVYRTDKDGTILAKSDGRTITWQTGLPSVTARKWD